MSLVKDGPMLGARLRHEDAEELGATATLPGRYGNHDGRAVGFIVEPHERRDGATVFCVYRLVAS